MYLPLYDINISLFGKDVKIINIFWLDVIPNGKKLNGSVVVITSQSRLHILGSKDLKGSGGEKMKEILRLEEISLTYQAENGEVPALSEISFSVTEGELVVIVGPSGCGKSTLLSVISGLEPPSSGQILLGGKPVTEVSAQIGYMLQKDNLLDWRTIRSNVLLGLEIRRMLTPENIAYAESLLETYGLGEFRDKYPSQLSGGMRQRAALIRTLATRPELLLLDEAFSALDYQTRLAVTDDVFHILKQEGKSALIVTHDIPEGLSMADRVVVLSSRPGRVKSIHPMEFDPIPQLGYRPPLERRNAPGFGEYFNIIWKELDVHG